MPAPYAIGIDLGGTELKLLGLDPEGPVRVRRRLPTGATQGREWAETVRRGVAALRSELGPSLRWVGLSAPGLAAADRRSIAWMGGRLEALTGLDWGSFLDLGLPVTVLNDAHAALLGEVRQGAARGARHALLLTLGTGVGGAILSEGRLLRGQIGRAGHLGHLTVEADGTPDIVGTPGSLEDAIGECTLPARSAGRFRFTRELLEAVRGGDGQAVGIWERSLRLLAVGLNSLINVLDPEVIILGGGISQAGEELFAPLRRMLEPLEWRPHGHQVRLVPAVLGQWAGALGAAYHALQGEAGGGS